MERPTQSASIKLSTEIVRLRFDFKCRFERGIYYFFVVVCVKQESCLWNQCENHQLLPIMWSFRGKLPEKLKGKWPNWAVIWREMTHHSIFRFVVDRYISNQDCINVTLFLGNVEEDQFQKGLVQTRIGSRRDVHSGVQLCPTTAADKWGCSNEEIWYSSHRT